MRTRFEIVASAAFSWLLLQGDSWAQIDPNGPTVFAIELTPGQVVPASSSPHSGTGLAFLDPVASTLRIDASWSGTTGAFNQLVLGVGKPGIAGVEVQIVPSGPTSTNSVVGPFSAAALQQLYDGDFFVSVQSSTFASGELRGQLAMGHRQFVAFARGSKCVPPSGSFATARATFTLDPSSHLLTVAGDHSGLFGAPTSIAIRRGDPNQNGPLVYSIAPGPTASFSAVLGPVSELDRASLRAGDWYLEIQTPGFPSGEVRGQIVMAFFEYGDGCPGGAGPLRLRATSGYPTPGGTFIGEITGGAPGGVALILRSLGAAEIPVGYGCPIYMMLPMAPAVPITLDGQGSLVAAKPLPLTLPTPCLVHVQVLAADPSAPNGLFSASNGLAIDITK